MPDLNTSRKMVRKRLRNPARCLILGAMGAGMNALAEILLDAGHSVLGLDTNAGHRSPNGNQETSADRFVILPWSVDSLPAEHFDLCVTSSAVAQNDAVLEQIRELQIPVTSLHECLAVLFSGTTQICVAGTHGKSTTASMLAWILQQSGYAPGFFVGARQKALGCSGRFADTGWSVLESCEFRHAFQQFTPTISVLTGVERDHFDCFPDQSLEDDAYLGFLRQTADDGVVVYDVDCNRSESVVGQSSRQSITFGVGDRSNRGSEEPDWLGLDPVVSGMETSFRCVSESFDEVVRLNIPGTHNVKNALAALVAATSAGVSPSGCIAALRSFTGIQRRFEFCGSYRGMLLVDDYAHHPTAVRAALSAAKHSFPNRRLIVAFEPHQLIRTHALFIQFMESLSLADEIMILPVFPARESATHLECCRVSGQLVKELNRQGSKAFLFANLDQIVSRIDHSGRPTDLFLTMGAGRTNIIHDELTRRLQRHSVA